MPANIKKDRAILDNSPKNWAPSNISNHTWKNDVLPKADSTIQPVQSHPQIGSSGLEVTARMTCSMGVDPKMVCLPVASQPDIIISQSIAKQSSKILGGSQETSALKFNMCSIPLPAVPKINHNLGKHKAQDSKDTSFPTRDKSLKTPSLHIVHSNLIVVDTKDDARVSKTSAAVKTAQEPDQALLSKLVSRNSLEGEQLPGRDVSIPISGIQFGDMTYSEFWAGGGDHNLSQRNPIRVRGSSTQRSVSVGPERTESILIERTRDQQPYHYPAFSTLSTEQIKHPCDYVHHAEIKNRGLRSSSFNLGTVLGREDEDEEFCETGTHSKDLEVPQSHTTCDFEELRFSTSPAVMGPEIVKICTALGELCPRPLTIMDHPDDNKFLQPNQHFKCSYCGSPTSNSIDSDTLAICLGCGPCSKIRYCDVGCLLADAIDHQQVCGLHSGDWPIYWPLLPQSYQSLCPAIVPLVDISNECFRQMVWSAQCHTREVGNPFLACWKVRYHEFRPELWNIPNLLLVSFRICESQITPGQYYGEKHDRIW